ncbi:Wzz/FepE/Etk N-terminal domain-containing protein [Nocardioides sp. Arc9.136]|uniref:Wzz/FepE/Etk N-terminal domain-containing protein n=1 Tax=Nocardioides sp. Arc9.136 TaxID=2996826 RepID=UPI002665FFE1|nr:Wzz/FepE/Etk N-terminal domain-containing protein [Nocardioides sp. Arc9.136]WKN48582.1 hypothetical protein OSR43_00200 [Nocardioides sp. Arc9.136]
MYESRIISSTHDRRVGTDQSQVLASMQRHWVLVLVLTLLGAVAGLLLTNAQPTTYQAESRVFLSSNAAFDPTGMRTYVNDPSRFVEEQAEVMTSTPVLEGAIESGAPADSVLELRKQLEVVPADESDIVTVRASSVSEAAAIAMVDEIVQAYRTHVSAGVAATMEKIDDVVRPDRLQFARREAALFGDGVSLAEPAAAEQTSSLLRNAALLGLVGLMCSIGLSLLRDRVAAGTRSAPGPAVAERPLPERPDAGARTTAPGRRRTLPPPAGAVRQRDDELSPEAS